MYNYLHHGSLMSTQTLISLFAWVTDKAMICEIKWHHIWVLCFVNDVHQPLKHNSVLILATQTPPLK